MTNCVSSLDIEMNCCRVLRTVPLSCPGGHRAPTIRPLVGSVQLRSIGKSKRYPCGCFCSVRPAIHQIISTDVGGGHNGDDGLPKQTKRRRRGRNNPGCVIEVRKSSTCLSSAELLLTTELSSSWEHILRLTPPNSITFPIILPFAISFADSRETRGGCSILDKGSVSSDIKGCVSPRKRLEISPFIVPGVRGGFRGCQRAL